MLNTSAFPQMAPQYDLQELYDVGLHYGHQVRKWYPRMKPWIYMEKNGVHIFDLAKTASQLQTAYNFAYQLGLEGKTMLVICTKRQAREMITAAAAEAGCSYISARWLGGLFTNWEQVYKSLQRMLKTREQLEIGAYKGHTKYEIVQIEKDLARLERFFGGVQALKKLPDALLVIDPVREHNAVAEATAVGVPIMALIDSDGNPDAIDIPIPGNDDAIKSITYIVTQVTSGYKAGKLARDGKKVMASDQPGAAKTPVVLPATEAKTMVVVQSDGVKMTAVTEKKTEAEKKVSPVGVAKKVAEPTEKKVVKSAAKKVTVAKSAAVKKKVTPETKPMTKKPVGAQLLSDKKAAEKKTAKAKVK